jgi:hypothetical protein
MTLPWRPAAASGLGEDVVIRNESTLGSSALLSRVACCYAIVTLVVYGLAVGPLFIVPLFVIAVAHGLGEPRSVRLA